MADQTTATATATSPKPEESSVAPVEVRATTADATTDGVAAAPTEGATTTAESDAGKVTADEPTTSSTDDKPAEKDDDVTVDTETAAAANEPASADANGAAATPKTNGKRKSTGSVPEHKKKLQKRKSMPNLNLDVKPGEYWMARMKGYAAWPVIICDEAMLPETLLGKRPVSAIRPDGTYREDFADGGKNVRDRRYPVMFLGTNEFAWQVNTDLTPLDMDDVKRAVANDEQGKKTKALWEAWKVTAQEHDLEYFKQLLMDHEKALAEDAEERAQKEAEKAEKAAEKEKAKANKAKRKSKGGAAEDEDVEMEDAGDETDAAKKSSKKRKKETDSEAEALKPTKTPKTKLKVNGPKTPATDTPTKTKKTPASKAKGSKAKGESEEATPKAEAEPLTEAQKLEKRQKAILYLRHRLQKGFLTRDQPPKPEEMQQMSEYFSDLERHTDLEVNIIKETKINKVLKAIIKLDSIPKDEEYNFKKRSTELLTAWNKQIASENEPASTIEPVSAAPESATNGSKEETADTKSPAEEKTPAAEESKSEEPKAEESKDIEMKEPGEAPVETKTDLGNKAGDEGDVAMEDAKPAEAAPDATEGAKEAEKPAQEAQAS